MFVFNAKFPDRVSKTLVIKALELLDFCVVREEEYVSLARDEIGGSNSRATIPNLSDFKASILGAICADGSIITRDEFIEALFEKLDEQLMGNIGRGWEKYHSGAFWDAIEEFNLAIAMKHKVIEGYYGRAKSLFKLGYCEKALDDLIRVENREEDHEFYFEDLFTLRGRIRMIMHDFENAISEFDKALEHNELLSEVYALRGFAKKELGMKDSGDLDLARAKALGFQINI